MKKTIAILVVAGLGIASVNAGVRFGIKFGMPIPVPVIVAPAPVVVPAPMPAPMVEVTPACPAPGSIWVGGNWGWCDNQWVWTRGHWGPPAHWDHDARWGQDGHRDHGYRAERHEDFHGRSHAEHDRR
jgi:hypothetical protein